LAVELTLPPEPKLQQAAELELLEARARLERQDAAAQPAAPIRLRAAARER
jgi:hypothetical protein